jgi:hypothetical protein
VTDIWIILTSWSFLRKSHVGVRDYGKPEMNVRLTFPRAKRKSAGMHAVI